MAYLGGGFYSSLAEEEAARQAEIDKLAVANRTAQNPMSAPGSAVVNGLGAYDATGVHNNTEGWRGALSNRGNEFGYYNAGGWNSVGNFTPGSPEWLAAVNRAGFEGNQTRYGTMNGGYLDQYGNAADAPQNFAKGFMSYEDMNGPAQPIDQEQLKRIQANLGPTGVKSTAPITNGPADPRGTNFLGGVSTRPPSPQLPMADPSAFQQPGTVPSAQAQQPQAGFQPHTPPPKQGMLNQGTGFNPFGMNSFFKNYWGK